MPSEEQPSESVARASGSLSSPVATPAGASNPVVTPVVNLSQADDSADDDLEDESKEHLVHLGLCNLSIVGIRYYDGEAHPGEYVKLVREPYNPYDANAIRIENMHGEKVGHIKREQAKVLAGLMDDEALDLQIDGTIPYRGDVYTIPVRVDIYAKSAAPGAINLMRNVEKTMSRVEAAFKKGYIQFSALGTPSAAPVAAAAAAVVQVQKQNLDWKTQQKELDDMFDKQSREQLAQLPDIPMPISLLLGGVELFEFQKVGIRWMVHQERKQNVPFFRLVTENKSKRWLCEITNSSQDTAPKPVHGGILADEMGLGKTLQAIGLILANPPAHCNYSKTAASANVELDDANDKGEAAALPETDNASLSLPTKTMVNKFKVDLLKKLVAKSGIVVSNPKKAGLVEACLEAIQKGVLRAIDFTPNAILRLEEEASNIAAAAAASAAAESKPKSNATCTLIVCPVSVMSNWVQQIESHVEPGALRVALYHGSDRFQVLPQLTEHQIDVLIVSYHTLAADHCDDSSVATAISSSAAAIDDDDEDRKPKAKKRKVKEETLFNQAFHRIILDEAHTIRSSRTSLFKAVASLKADYRFCLTGTPFVNRPDDIRSLLTFLGVEPLGDQDIFRRAITLPIQQGDGTGLARLRTTMAHVALRRSKELAQIKLSGKEVQLRVVQFPPGRHKTIHDALFDTAQRILSATLQSGDGDKEILSNYSNILELLLRIRQACCSAELVPEERRQRAEEVLKEMLSRQGQSMTRDEAKSLLEKLKGTLEVNEECAICLCEMEESAVVILRPCQHVFCDACIAKVTAGNNSSRCPLCRQEFSQNDMIKKSVATSRATEEHVSTPDSSNDEIGNAPKVAAMLMAINEMNTDEKGVIFSQFTKYLDVIGKALKDNGHSFTRIDGSKNPAERIRAMKQFTLDGAASPRFILCSLHAAGTGINLTRGNHIFMMDTWWNVAAENQAMDRVHRIGQQRDVRVIRFIMAGSIEERMVALQEGKAAIGKGAMEKLKPEEQRKARITALRELFLIGKE